MFDFRFWGRSVLFTLGAAALLGVPTVLIPTPWFHRMIPTRPLDYLIWGISVLLLGPLLALTTRYPPPADTSIRERSGGVRVVLGGILTFLSVGCPICNQLVVLLLGIGGAMTFFNPLRPFLGIAAVVILAVTLSLRVRVLRSGCPVRFEGSSTATPESDVPSA